MNTKFVLAVVCLFLFPGCLDSSDAESLASSLASEEDVVIGESSFSFTLIEPRAKDARAMWNTRMRSVIVSYNILKVMDS